MHSGSADGLRDGGFVVQGHGSREIGVRPLLARALDRLLQGGGSGSLPASS